MVRVGSTALRATCFHSTQLRDAPLARATATKGWVSTSSMLRIRICASGAEIGMASVATGRISRSTGPGLITETRPSWKEKIWISMMPSQNTGTEMNSDGSDCKEERSHAMPTMFDSAASAIVSDHCGDEAQRRQQQRRRQVGRQLLAHRHAGLDGIAEIAGEEIGHGLEILLPDRQVGAVGRADLGDLVGAETHLGAHELDHHRIARQHLQQQERGREGDDQDRQSLRDPADQVTDHGDYLGASQTA